MAVSWAVFGISICRQNHEWNRRREKVKWCVANKSSGTPDYTHQPNSNFWWKLKVLSPPFNMETHMQHFQGPRSFWGSSQSPSSMLHIKRPHLQCQIIPSPPTTAQKVSATLRAHNIDILTFLHSVPHTLHTCQTL